MTIKKIKFDYDVAVIGGGPAGMIAAIQAAQKGLRVVLLEKNKQLGKKLLLSGGGRCNLTNAEFNLKNLVANYHNGEFLFHTFSIFGPKETIEFFENLGVKTKIENNNRVFPKSDRANDVLESLKKCMEKSGVKIIYDSEIIDIKKTRKRITKILLEEGQIIAQNYILATGGKSYSQTGSDGFGYKLSEKLGHTIIKPSPALTPIQLSENWVKNLQGITLNNIKINSEFGDIMFTNFGISGPVALNISSEVKKGSIISLDLFPDLNQEEVLKSFEEILKKYPKQIIKNILCEFAPERFTEVFLDILKIDKKKIANNMSKAEKALIVKNLKNFEMTVEDVLGFEWAMVTRGGISLKEIDHKTMKSKIIDNLYFAGEIIDVDGKTGGFNLQICWTTGYIAGTCILGK